MVRHVKEFTLIDERLPPAWVKKVVKRKNSRKWDVIICSPCGVRFYKKNGLIDFLENDGLPYDPEDFNFSRGTGMFYVCYVYVTVICKQCTKCTVGLSIHHKKGRETKEQPSKQYQSCCTDVTFLLVFRNQILRLHPV